MKILLIDDHHLIGKSLELTLSKHPEVEDFKHLIDPALAYETIASFHPSILLMDIHMGEYNGLELGEELLQQFPIKLIFLSGFHLIEYREKAEAIGAHGFFSKNTPIDSLIENLVRVHLENAHVFPPKEERDLLYHRLGPREKEILQLLSQGVKQTAIADDLKITERTVRNHIYTINEKLGTTSALTAVVKAIELGIVQVKLQ